MTVPALDDVLSEVNKIRVALGGKPLLAIRKGKTDSNQCPIARSLNDLIPAVIVGGNVILGLTPEEAQIVSHALGCEVADGEVMVWHPDMLRNFVWNFDHHKYPELVMHHSHTSHARRNDENQTMVE